MSIKISFTGNTVDQIRAEARVFFDAKPALDVRDFGAVGDTASAEPSTDDKDALVARGAELGLKLSKRMKPENMQKAIEEAEAAQAPATPATPAADDSVPFDSTSAEPEDETDDPFALDAPEPEATPATKEDVRAALIGYQTALKAKFIGNGRDEKEGSKAAMERARDLLKKVGGTDNLGGLDDSKFDAVVKAATKATADL